MEIARAGGIGPLLAIVTSRNPHAQAQGASALALSRFNRDNQDSVARAGGIKLLVDLLAPHHPLDVQVGATDDP